MFAGSIAACAVIAGTGCGNKATPYKAPPKLAEGLTACGGGLSLHEAGKEPEAGSLAAKGTVASIDRGEHGIRIALDGGQTFGMSLHKDLEPPVKVGDALDVSIDCSPVARDLVACGGVVLRGGALVAFDREVSAAQGWTITRGPLLERDPHPNYGPTETYALVFTHDGVTATTPLRGCTELRSAQATFRIGGGEIEHLPPRASGSSDFRHFSVVRMP